MYYDLQGVCPEKMVRVNPAFSPIYNQNLLQMFTLS